MPYPVANSKYLTPQTLLDRIKSGDDSAWGKFIEFYTPLIVHLARTQFWAVHLNLRPKEIEELILELEEFIFRKNLVTKYQKEKGRFRTYFGKAIANKLKDLREQKLKIDRREVPYNDEIKDDLYGDVDSEMENQWDHDYQKYLLYKALELLRSRVEEKFYQAFDLYALKRVPAEATAARLGLTKNQVFQAKNRLTGILKEIVRELQENE